MLFNMSLFSNLKPKANLSRNVFDRSRSETFSTKLGIITPCFIEHTIPKGKYKINMSDIVRVSEQQTANFVGFNQCFEFAFVPYSQLWHNFNRFYYGRGEDTRSVTSSPSQIFPSYCPTFNLREVQLHLMEGCLYGDWYHRQVQHLLETGHPIPEMLTDFGEAHGVVVPSGGSWYDTDFCDVHNRFCAFDQLRTLDMLGYGNFLPIVKYYWVDMNVVEYNQLTQATLDSIEGTVNGVVTHLGTLLRNSGVNAFTLMAYVKFFSDIYRNRQYDNHPYHEFYNVDWYQGNNLNVFSGSNVVRMLKPFYRQYKKDLFTGLYPESQFGSVSVASVDGSSVTLSRTPDGGNLPTLTLQAKGFGSSSTGGVLSMSNSGTSYQLGLDNINVSALAIRQAEALQRWKEKIMRAGTREKDLQKAIFGVDSHYIEDAYVDFLGSYQTPIQMNPVAATTAASVDGSKQDVGDLGAYSVGSLAMGSQKEIEFDAYDFGIIIGICYIMPDTKYEAYGLDSQNIKQQPSDYFMPQMANLGLAPIYSYQANVFDRILNPNTTVLGYLARYYEYKTAISRVHGEFYGSNPAIPIKAPDDYDAQDYARNQLTSVGAFADFVAPRDVREYDVPTVQMLYINPSDADNIFHLAEGYQQLFDHFKFEVSFRVKAVLPMSVIGLPE